MAAPAAAAAGLVSGDKASGILKGVVDALNHDIVTLHWERERTKWGSLRREKKLVLASVDFHFTNGLFLGVVFLGLSWEIGNWFAQAINKAGQIPLISDLLDPAKFETVLYDVANPVGAAATGIAGAFQKLFTQPKSVPSGTTAGPGQKVVQLPPTFGAALNRALRDITVAGPGTLGQNLVSLISKLQPPQ